MNEQDLDSGAHIFCEAMNEIAIEIGKAVAPLNHDNLPFIAACLSSYSDTLVADMNPIQKMTYAETRELMRNATTVRIEIPTKGGK